MVTSCNNQRPFNISLLGGDLAIPPSFILWIRTDQIVTELIIDGEWIETTPEHPFYVDGKGWVDAEDLEIGDEVRQADGNTGIVWLQWNVKKTQAPP